MGGGGGGCLFEAGRLLTFSAFRMGAYLRWALIRGWAFIRINTVTSPPPPGTKHVPKVKLSANHQKKLGTISGNLLGITNALAKREAFRVPFMANGKRQIQVDSK